MPETTTVEAQVQISEPATRNTPLPAEPNSPQALLQEYARTRDRQLRDRLVEVHQPLVRYCAMRFASGGTPIEDLTQVAYIGLLAAIERYEPGRGISFSAFATPTILGEIKRYLRDHTWGLKAPRRLRELGLSIRKLRDRLEQKLGRPPTVPELAEAAGVTQEKLIEALELDWIYQPASLDAAPDSGSGEDRATFWESVGRTDPRLNEIEEKEVLRAALEQLDERQRRIVHYRFFEGVSQAEAARRLGISQMHVSRLERQALKVLKSFLS